MSFTQPARVGVVGAGIAGLTAAHFLRRLGVDTIVFEADGRVGGRMTSERATGHVIDRAAQFLSSEYSTILGLVRDVGLANQVRPTSRLSAIVQGGVPRRLRVDRVVDALFSGLLGTRAWLMLGRVALREAHRIRNLSLSDFSAWDVFDDCTASDWLQREKCGHALERIFEPMLQGFYFQRPEDTSRALAMALMAFGMRRSQTLTLEGGLGQLPEALAARLDVRLNETVEGVKQSNGKVAIQTASQTVIVDRAIVATPATVARQLLADPQDEAGRDLLATQYTSSINVSVFTDPAFALPTALREAYGLLIPRSERHGVAAIGIENNKRGVSSTSGQLFSVMFCHDGATHLMSKPDAVVVQEAIAQADRYLPGMAGRVIGSWVFRWPAAEPCSMVGRATALRRYRTQCAISNSLILLAGDYMSMPFTEGAAESGLWAANSTAGKLFSK